MDNAWKKRAFCLVKVEISNLKYSFKIYVFYILVMMGNWFLPKHVAFILLECKCCVG